MSNAGLFEADFEMFARLRIPPELVAAAQICRVTHAEAQDVCGVRYRSAHLEGLAFPNLDPVSHTVRTFRVRRDHPEYESGGRPIAKT